jgi:hypothetical protein
MIQDPSLIVSQDVEGAPVRMGEVVRVSKHCGDGSICERFLGRAGVVVALVYDDPRKQYPHDPLVQVRVQGVGEELFFPEEFTPVSARGLRVLSGLGELKDDRGPPPP